MQNKCSYHLQSGNFLDFFSIGKYQNSIKIKLSVENAPHTLK